MEDIELLLLSYRAENRQFEVREDKQMRVHVLVGRGLFVLIYVRRCLAVPQLEDKRRMVPPFLLLMIHIGKIIEEEFYRQGRSVSWLAGKLCCDRTNVYNIFKRESIDTALLTKISEALNHNFFVYYVDYLKGE